MAGFSECSPKAVIPLSTKSKCSDSVQGQSVRNPFSFSRAVSFRSTLSEPPLTPRIVVRVAKVSDRVRSPPIRRGQLSTLGCLHGSQLSMFTGKQFNIEHALNMYALSYVLMPAFGIYDKKMVEPFREGLKTCHIYVIGTLPKVDSIGARQEEQELITSYEVAGAPYELRWPLGADYRLIKNENHWVVVNDAGDRLVPNDEVTFARLSDEFGIYDFKVLYVGQAYGTNGSRNALDRLLKHETLQRISLKGIPKGQELSLLMLEIEPANRVFTVINPFAEDKTQGTARIASGVAKLFGTSEAERITLYEASLIRYFQPVFNTEFRDSFPSTNLKVLRDCYDKDFSAVIAEFSFDDIPFRLFSDAVPPTWNHIASFDLHEDASRQVFFFK